MGMTLARRQQIDPTMIGCYHLISRCVRRAFLCGGDADHRREWIEQMLRDEASAFSVDIMAYAVMSNHLHVVVKAQPDRARTWSPMEVTERWARLFPMRDDRGDPLPPAKRWLDAWSKNEGWVAERRSRLASLSWLMKIIKERIARRANREDKCTGHFWEGRFTSVRLLDQAAVIACMAYVDLNPIRARMSDRPERSARTSVQERIRLRRESRALSGSAPATSAAPATLASWLAPLAHCHTWSDELGKQVARKLSDDDYLELVDQTGRIVVAGKRGAIPMHLAPILQRLDIDLGRWMEAMANGGRFRGSAVGSAAERAKEAAVRGLSWLADKTGIHRIADAVA